MDLTVDVGFQDFGFSVENADRASAVTVRVYHTDEIRLFCQLLAVAVADRSATSAVANIERELRRICVGMKPSEQGEHRLHEAEHTWKTTPADWTDEHMVYPSPSDGDELQVTTVEDGVEFRWMTGDVVQATFTCQGATIPQVLAGMMWRTYCQPDETVSWLSRTPTLVYERLLELASDER